MTSTALVSPDVETIFAEPGVAQSSTTCVDESRVSAALTKGIHIGSQWISWGFLKGSEFASSMVEKVLIMIFPIFKQELYLGRNKNV